MKIFYSCQNRIEQGHIKSTEGKLPREQELYYTGSEHLQNLNRKKTASIFHIVRNILP